MSKLRVKKFLDVFINTIVLIITLYIINIGIETLTPAPKWYINILSIIVYIVWLYFLLKNNNEKRKQLTKINIIIGIFTFVLLGISSITMFNELIKENGVENVLKSYGGFGKIIYFAICFLQPIILPLPEPITITAGNVVFGKFIGFSLGFLGTILGIITMFIVSKVGNTHLNLNLITAKNLEKYNNLVKKNESIILMLLFIFPILPDEIICIGAGLSPIKFRKFVSIAILSKFITVGTYTVSSGIVKEILQLGLAYQLVIIAVVILVLFILKKLISYIKLRS